MTRYNKLVRDLIPEIIVNKGGTAKIHVATPEEYDAKLREKLQEEVDEYLQSGDVIELADILEVIRALAPGHGCTPEYLENLRFRKAVERGAFEKRIILEES